MLILGLSNTDSENILIYPNPASTSVKIEFTKTQLPVDVSIYDVSAKLIKRMTLTSTSETIDLHGLENGVYIIKFTNESEELIQHSKLIINK